MSSLNGWIPTPRPGAGSSVVVYADEPPADAEVGTVYIDATGQGINPDGSRT